MAGPDTDGARPQGGPGPDPGALPAPPSPERRPTVLRAHGDERIDDWYWLADRDDPALLPHLEAENAYTEAALGHLAPFRQALYEEMVARIAETDLTVPVRHGPWWYYSRTEEKKNYAIHCRRPAAGGEDPPLDTAPAAQEQVLLDENLLAEGLEYFEVGNLAVSPDHRWLAYATDTTGGEVFALSFRALDDAAPGLADEVVPDTYYGLAWANDNATVFYTRVDEAMRPYQLWRHRLGNDPGDDVLVLEEADGRFTVSVGWTKDRAYVVATLQSNTTSEVWVIPGDDPESPARVVEPRRQGVEYAVEHLAGAGELPGSLLLVTNDEALDFRLVAVPADAPARERWRTVLDHRPGTRLDDVDVFEGWLVVSERLDAELRLRVVPVGGAGDDPFGTDPLGGSWLVGSDEHPAVTWEGPNPEHRSASLRFEQSSLVSPRAIYDADLATGRPTLRKRQPVLGGYDPSRYRTYRLWADAADGSRVPISVVHRADLLADPGAVTGTAPAAPAPCLLYGYGAYEQCVEPAFSSLRLSLLDRGFVFAIAHVRGGGELGRQWYEDGKLSAKPHTFTDFIDCARHLVARGFTTPDLLAARGGSAGGMLMGAVINLAPELFGAVVAEVPFVDCLTTMLDDTLPLTVGEWEEWGNPVTDPAAYATMKSYSPYDNVASRHPDGTAVRHPRVLATAGLHDPRVGYWEPAKWVARLREAEPGNRVLLKTELVAGHAGPSGRYDAWRDEALVVAFVLDALGLAGD